ncbi:Ovarian-specific serine/threonine-protein kinase Lok [Grifola frondosa]|uniref:Ovarian-specific serine/threonine-protein kinase Lok n=1 Tax=Grifola frondosa TaxID=5627 RepID=A0A1C7MNP5_GRIFR|nr:Ovarian-specific serine/threonine-protein kinase Lok [Grifola frondosa]
MRLWGSLVPFDRVHLSRMNFELEKLTYTIGRYRGHDFKLPWSAICKTHCIIEWDGLDTAESIVKITDLSLHGTYVNGKVIEKKKCAVLLDGDEVSFLSCCTEDQFQYRYTYRRLTYGLTSGGYVDMLDLRYNIGKELGRGAYATVFKAKHRKECRVYAIKVIRRNNHHEFLTSDGGSIYEREIAILETLLHPYICAMKEVVYESDKISLIMEYVAGGDLRKYMLRLGRMDEGKVQRITFQLCERGIQNILITADELPNVKLTDFGLSKAIDGNSLLQTMCGTLLYVAPEVVNQEKHEGYDLVVDSWSIGAIVFEMLTNCTAFKGQDGLDFGAWIRSRKVQWDNMRYSGVAGLAYLCWSSACGRSSQADDSHRCTQAPLAC